MNQDGVQLHCDSQSVIYLAKCQVYLAVRFHKIRLWIVIDEFFLEKDHTLENVVDVLAKLVPIDKFKHCLDLVGVCSL